MANTPSTVKWRLPCWVSRKGQITLSTSISVILHVRVHLADLPGWRDGSPSGQSLLAHLIAAFRQDRSEPLLEQPIQHRDQTPLAWRKYHRIRREGYWWW